MTIECIVFVVCLWCHTSPKQGMFKGSKGADNRAGKRPTASIPARAPNPPHPLHMRTQTALALTLAIAATGCSTITQDQGQTLSLTATYQGQPVEAECRLENDKGQWTAKSPTNVNVRKSNEDLNVTCKKEGLPDGLLKAISRAAGSMFGNIIFGGGIGALIDHNKGTGYDYPNQLPVKMGESTLVDKKEEKQNKVATN